MSKNIEVSLGIKIISILGYISSVLSILFGVLFLIGSSFSFVISLIGEKPILSGVLIILTWFSLFILYSAGPRMVILVGSELERLYILGIIYIGLGIFEFSLARGLWKGKNWARIVAIIFCISTVVITIISMITINIITLDMSLALITVNLIISMYLIFSNSVKEAFE